MIVSSLHQAAAFHYILVYVITMIVFINFGNGGNPLHALSVLLLCVAFNLAFDFLVGFPA